MMESGCKGDFIEEKDDNRLMIEVPFEDQTNDDRAKIKLVYSLAIRKLNDSDM